MLAAIVLAAGKGTRMRSDLPKVLHRVAGRPLLDHVLSALAPLTPAPLVVVASPDNVSQLKAGRDGAVFAIQAEQRGTGDAAKAGLSVIPADRRAGTVLILTGDAPMIPPESLKALVERRLAAKAAIAVMGFRPSDPTGYGRLITAADGTVERIVEHRDASEAERAVDLCNGGIFAVDGMLLEGWLDKLAPTNAQGEFYLTDIVALARAGGRSMVVLEVPPEDVAGINSRAELAAAELTAQQRLRELAMAGGATLIDPDTVYLSMDTVIGRDVTIGPNVVILGGVEIGDRVEIRAFSHLEGAKIGAGALVGPFARLRPGTVVGADAHVGNFVELKNAVLGEGAKANHLSYVGDAEVGPKANIGAGVITCNYDGINKWQTTIGAGAFIGSNAALVAPVSVGAGAIVGAGSVIVADVPADAIAVARGAQSVKPDAASSYRERLRARKSKQNA